ncbi:MAG: protein translocase subunit SecF [Candidatus Sungbacteria bacterium]|nr:protein translocase subunit SecF [bacterium]MDZ4285372.1 protein translocase subunit SecF [Candidatus Sungbacteria bacterium]
MNIIGHKYVYLTFSSILLLASVIALMVWKLNVGIDFTGGSVIELEFTQGTVPTVDNMKQVLAPLNLGDVTIQSIGEKGMMLRFRDVDEATHQNMLSAMGGLQGPKETVERRFDTIGPTVGKELRTQSFVSIGLTALGIMLYLAWAFRRVSKPVASWKYGVVAVSAFVHDVIIPVGVFAFLGHFYGVVVDSLFITALLTVMGFSVHDTIVIFDRIRENLAKLKAPEPYEVTVNRSVNETISRSINTTLTVLIVLLAIFFFGGVTTKYFALALIVGIIFGTYSSIFVASPLLVIWEKAQRKNRNKS